MSGARSMKRNSLTDFRALRQASLEFPDGGSPPETTRTSPPLPPTPTSSTSSSCVLVDQAAVQTVEDVSPVSGSYSYLENMSPATATTTTTIDGSPATTTSGDDCSTAMMEGDLVASSASMWAPAGEALASYTLAPQPFPGGADGVGGLVIGVSADSQYESLAHQSLPPPAFSGDSLNGSSMDGFPSYSDYVEPSQHQHHHHHNHNHNQQQRRQPPSSHSMDHHGPHDMSPYQPFLQHPTPLSSSSSTSTSFSCQFAQGDSSFPGENPYYNPFSIPPRGDINVKPAFAGRPKRKRIINKEQRKAANIRERRRMCTLNEAFEGLRERVPTFSYEKKLSRMETLKLAITYINFMMDVINDGCPESQIEKAMSSTLSRKAINRTL